MFTPMHGGLEQGVHAFLKVERLGIKHQVRLHGFLEGAILAGEVFNLAFGGFGVKALDVARGTGGEACLDIDFEKIRAEDAACDIAEFAARGDGGDDGDEALLSKKFRDFGNAADVFQAVVIGESEVGIEAGADVIAIEDDGGAALLMKHAFGGIGDGGFSRTGQTAEPDDDATLPEQSFFVFALQEAVELGVDVRCHGKRLHHKTVPCVKGECVSDMA